MADVMMYPKADTTKRFVALLIDWILAVVVGTIPFVGWIVGSAYIIFRDGFDFDFMKHRSIGKQLMKLKVVSLGSEKPIDVNTSLKRNILLAIPSLIEIIPVLGWILALPAAIVILIIEGTKVLNDPHGRRNGDMQANTMVIEEGAQPVSQQESPNVPQIIK